jgi:hypothetical protein
MVLIGKALARACAAEGAAPEVHTELCRAQLSQSQEAHLDAPEGHVAPEPARDNRSPAARRAMPSRSTR